MSYMYTYNVNTDEDASRNVYQKCFSLSIYMYICIHFLVNFGESGREAHYSDEFYCQ